MDIHHFNGKKSRTESRWVYTQKGYDYLVSKNVSDVESRKPGMPVSEFYHQSCPAWWTHNGWVEEGA